MSDRNANGPALPLSPEHRNGCGSAFLLFFGLILLLPSALCVVIAPGWTPWTGRVLIVAAVGLALVMVAFGTMRKPKS